MTDTTQLKYIGAITIDTVRDFILSHTLSEDEKIMLHPHTLDELALNHRNVLGYSITEPFFYLGVEIVADQSLKTPKDRICILDKNDDEPLRRITIMDLPPDPKLKKIYRCFWCGGIVADDGSNLPVYLRKENEEIIEKYHNEVNKVLGKCCEKDYHNNSFKPTV